MKQLLAVSWRGLAMVAALCGSSLGSRAHADPAMCDRAARQAAAAAGIPPAVLLAITRTETGRSRAGVMQPWPWTVNMEGAGKWFDTLESAKSHVFEHFKAGARSFDVGCFQINYKWHGAAFRSIEDMFDPEISARYAAELLRDLYRATGDWSQAAGAYHSRTPGHAARYRARFDAMLTGLVNPDTARPAQSMLSANTRPQTPRAGDASRLGSLVPLPQTGGGALLPMVTRGSL